VSSGPSGPTRGQGGAPAGRQTPQERPSWPRTWRPRTYDLEAGCFRAGWYSRRVRASAERGRVQGPGRAEADLSPRTVTVKRNWLRYSRAACEHRSWNCLVGLLATRSGTRTDTLIPTLMGTQATRVADEPGIVPFQQVRTLAGRGHAQKPGAAGGGGGPPQKPGAPPRPASLRRSPSDRFRARRWASFVGPRRAKLWKTDDWAGPAGRARIRAHPRKPTCGFAAIPTIRFGLLWNVAINYCGSSD
jgi:hypothetical protein